MRYRMEVVEDELVICNVETDVRLGTAIPYYAVDTGDPNRPLVLACNVLNSDVVSLAKIAVPNPLGQAAVVIANHEAHNGYPGLKKAAKGCNPHGSSGSSQELWPTPFLSLRMHASNGAMAV